MSSIRTQNGEQTLYVELLEAEVQRLRDAVAGVEQIIHLSEREGSHDVAIRDLREVLGA